MGPPKKGPLITSSRTVIIIKEDTAQESNALCSPAPLIGHLFNILALEVAVKDVHSAQVFLKWRLNLIKESRSDRVAGWD
jgi:hypothetical protein